MIARWPLLTALGLFGTAPCFAQIVTDGTVSPRTTAPDLDLAASLTPLSTPFDDPSDLFADLCRTATGERVTVRRSRAAPTCEQSGGAMARPASGEQAASLATWSAIIERRDAPASNRIEARIRRGETYRALGRYPDAETDLIQALKAARAEDDAMLPQEPPPYPELTLTNKNCDDQAFKRHRRLLVKAEGVQILSQRSQDGGYSLALKKSNIA